MREERTNRLRVFDNKLLKRIFRPKLDKVTGMWRKLHNGSLKIRNFHQILFGLSKRKDDRGKYLEENRRIQGWWGNLRKRVYLEDAGIDERII